MREIIEVIPTGDYQLKIAFDDGRRAIVDMKALMKRKVFQPLKDKSLFRQVTMDRKFGGVQWPNGADVCIDWIEAESKILDKSTEVDLGSQAAQEPRTRTKAGLISEIASKTEVPKKLVDQLLKSFIRNIRRTLEEDSKIRIPALGTFSVVQKAERNSHSILTGAKIKIPAIKAPRFRPSKSLKEAVNKSK